MDLEKHKKKLSDTITASNNEKLNLEGLQKEIAETKKNLKSLTIEKGKEQKEIDKIMFAKKNIGKQLKEISSVLAGKKKEVSEFEKQIKELDLESIEGIKTMNAQLDLVNKAIKEEKDGFKIDEANYEKEIEKLSIKKDEIIKVSKILEKDNDTLLNKNLELENETIEYSKMIAFDVEEMKKNKIAVEKAKDLLKTLQVQYVGLEAEKEIEEKELKNVKKEVEKENKKLDELEAESEKLIREKVALATKAEYLREQETYLKKEFKKAGILYEEFKIQSDSD